jgi:Zn-dependent M28 family amino/carboxypeptidase
VAFVALSAEEQGLFGGEIVARVAKQEGWRIDAVINNDMVGNIARHRWRVREHQGARVRPGLPANTPAAELRRILTNGGELDTPSRQLARYIDHVADRYFPNLDVEIIYRLDRYGRGGHHTPFFNQGAAAVRLMEAHEDYNKQHQDLRTENGIRYGDVLEGVDFDYAAKMTALDAAVLQSLAWAPAAPDSAHHHRSGAAVAHVALEAVAVARRDRLSHLLAQAQRRELDALALRGECDRVHAPNVIIDNYFFGVAAVGERSGEPGRVSALRYGSCAAAS